MVEQQLRVLADDARQRTDATLALLERLVRLESPTHEKAAVDRLIDWLSEQLQQRGWQVERLPQAEVGDVLIARLAGQGEQADAKPLHLMTHIDTVWAVGTIERLPWRVEGDELHGPGVYDMKAGVAMLLTATDVLREAQAVHRPFVWTINTDEEIGSPHSRAILEDAARGAELVLCFEPPIPPHGTLKTERKGVGLFTLHVEGRAAHAGADHASGVNAIEELARQVQRLHALTDYERGTTINVGMVQGGTARNVVPAEARAEIDLRVTTLAEADRVVPLIRDVRATVAGATARIEGGMNRPPMERTEQVVAAFTRAQEIGASIGQSLTEGSTGGASDGNFTSALGVPTIDGLGCPGDGAHADSEHILLSALPERTALLTALLAGL